MKKIAFFAAVVGLVAATGMLVTSCAARLMPWQQSGQSLAGAAGQAVAYLADRPLAKPATALRADSKVAVQIPWPAFAEPDRTAQFTYGGGSAVSAVEVFLLDSLNNYQSALVVRNTAANGTSAGTASITFTGVPAGAAVVTVHTTTRNLLGDLIIGASDAPTSYYSVLAGGATKSVTPMSGDQNSQFLVFRSSDLLSAAAANGAPSIYLTTDRVYDTGSRTNANEITDGWSSARAGYGLGHTKVTVPAQGSVNATVVVTAPPTFDPATYMALTDAASAATFSATDVANAMTLVASNTLLTDEILATDSALHTSQLTTPKSEIVDLAKDLGYRIPITQVSGNTIAFNTTKAFRPSASLGNLPAYNIYLLRGSAISLIHLKTLKPPTMVVLPDSVASAPSSLVNKGISLKSTETDSVRLILRDKFANPVSDIGKWAGPNANNTIRRSVSPLGNDANATRLLVPTRTVGSVSTFACADPVNKPGIWTATYTQGTLAATDKGASPSIAMDITAGSLTGLSQYFLSFDDFEANNLAVKVGATTPVTGEVKIEIFATQGATEAAQVRATAQFALSAVNTASASLPIFDGLYSLVTGGALTTTANGAAITNIVTKVNTSGASRKAGDTDRLSVSVASGSVTLFPSTFATYTWAK